MNISQFIKIQNFRCFEDLTVNTFKQVNLIGGKNNTGKTALLEALLLYFYPASESFLLLASLRKEPLRKMTKHPENAWDNLFYHQNLTNIIKLQGYFEIEGKKEISIEVFRFFDPFNIGKNATKLQNKNDLLPPSFSRETETIVGNHSTLLKIGCKINQNQVITSHLDIDLQGMTSTLPRVEKVPFISSSYFVSNRAIAELYDRVDYEGKAAEIFDLLKIFIPNLIGLKTYSFIEPTLHIQTQDNLRGLPITLFGDAVYRVTSIALELLTFEHKVLFIDEIENGIHYTCQKDVWKGLFRLAKQQNTLIFVTTHSLEMIKAFAEAGQDFPDQGAYFELAYSPRNQNIIAINRDMETLQYDLEHGKAIRGE